MNDAVSAPGPSLPDILDWLEGRLDPQRRREVGTAIAAAEAADDRTTVELVAWLRRFREDAGQLPLVAPPPMLAQRLRAIPRTRAGRVTVRVEARPTLDTRPSARPAGVRGAPQGMDTVRFQLGFAAPQAAVIIDVLPDDGGTVTLRGQVIPTLDTPRVFTATVSGPSGAVHTERGDLTGGFRLERVPLDVQRLMVSNDELEVSMSLGLSAGIG